MTNQNTPPQTARGPLAGEQTPASMVTAPVSAQGNVEADTCPGLVFLRRFSRARCEACGTVFEDVRVPPTMFPIDIPHTRDGLRLWTEQHVRPNDAGTGYELSDAAVDEVIRASFPPEPEIIGAGNLVDLEQQRYDAEIHAEVDALRAEVARLQQWKDEALGVLAKWNAVAALFPNLPLGSIIPDEVKRRVEALQEAVVDFIVREARFRSLLSDLRDWATSMAIDTHLDGRYRRRLVDLLARVAALLDPEAEP